MALTAGRFGVESRVVGDAAIKARFLEVGTELRTRARTVLVKLGVETRDMASALAPRRKTPMKKRRYGPLYKSIPVTFTETDTEMRVRVGEPVFYGRFQEDGVNEKTVKITNKRTRRHVRGVIGIGQRKMKDGSVRGVIRRGIVKRGHATNAYDKRVRVPAHPFMGPALVSMRDRVLSALGAVAVEAVEG